MKEGKAGSHPWLSACGNKMINMRTDAFPISVHTINEYYDTCICCHGQPEEEARWEAGREGGEIPPLIICTQEWHPESVMLIMHQITPHSTEGEKTLHALHKHAFLLNLLFANGPRYRNWERCMFSQNLHLFLLIAPVSTDTHTAILLVK